MVFPTGTTMGTVIKAVVNGVDQLFTEPKHCGEQTMIYTAPIVYGMDFLRQTGLVTKDNEVKGTAWITQGSYITANLIQLHLLLWNSILTQMFEY